MALGGVCEIHCWAIKDQYTVFASTWNDQVIGGYKYVGTSRESEWVCGVRNELREGEHFGEYHDMKKINRAYSNHATAIKHKGQVRKFVLRRKLLFCVHISCLLSKFKCLVKESAIRIKNVSKKENNNYKKWSEYLNV